MINKIKHWIESIRYYDLIVEDNERMDSIISKMTIDILKLKTKQTFKLPKPTIIYYKAPKRKRLTYYVRETDSPHITKMADLLISSVINNSDNEDGVVLDIMRWFNKQFLVRKFKYKSEKKECWEDPELTLERRYADCDGHSIVLYSLIRKVFKTLGKWEECRDRLYCCVGGVNHKGNTPYQVETHFYLVWKAVKDNEYYAVESTYLRGAAIADFLKVPHRNNTRYNYTVFVWNEELMYRVHAFRNLK